MTTLKIKPIHIQATRQAEARQAVLTKPAGSLGQLEVLAIQLAGHQGTVCPTLCRPWISVFAADHGIAEEGVSAFPSVVTQEMVKNFASGGAAITVLANAYQAHFEVVDVGVLEDVTEQGRLPLPNLISDRVAKGSQSFLKAPAMTDETVKAALKVGERAVSRALKAAADLFIAGEMGIGNTTSATALIAQVCQIPVADIVGLGTGIDETQKQHKATLIEQAQAFHQANMKDPLSILACLGGLEIAALVGAYLACAQKGLTIVVDGMIACSAALITCEMLPEAKLWMVFAHASVEPAQQAVFERLEVQPLLNLSLRLGEGSGAALAIPLIQAACLLHQQMATFTEANVSEGAVGG
ncbi:MAG: nicotinate-nucleotide--dimethylbenzimidazole phosphoribosyltransferase [Gammaproteobacteria bacterium]|nr:nicotinate-nucleotide--dimethylbenzimidazole phosphoribosyltransferase [Gammaproteobacteria bacterium]